MRCRGLHEVANPASLGGFLCSGLLSVAPYCAPGGIRVVSENRGLGVAGSFAIQMWQALEGPPNRQSKDPTRDLNLRVDVPSHSPGRISMQG
jgi:hypothetical protein